MCWIERNSIGLGISFLLVPELMSMREEAPAHRRNWNKFLRSQPAFNARALRVRSVGRLFISIVKSTSINRSRREERIKRTRALTRHARPPLVD